MAATFLSLPSLAFACLRLPSLAVPASPGPVHPGSPGEVVGGLDVSELLGQPLTGRAARQRVELAREVRLVEVSAGGGQVGEPVSAAGAGDGARARAGDGAGAGAGAGAGDGAGAGAGAGGRGRDLAGQQVPGPVEADDPGRRFGREADLGAEPAGQVAAAPAGLLGQIGHEEDRKSTRLNSS